MSETKTDARGLKPAAQNQEPPRGRPLTPADVRTVQLIPLELLHRSPYQVRREGDVSELAADIQAHGLVNPITVRRRAQNDGFEVVAGHRRWAAMRSIDPEGEVPCIVLEVDDRTAEELLVAENFVRSDLSIMEQAETVALLTMHGRTAEECGQVCRRSVRWAHRMRAIGGIVGPWREFFHVAGLPYEQVLDVARIPSDLREQAWRSFLGYLADALTYTVRKGNKDDEAARDVFLKGLEEAALDSRARLLDFLVRSAPPGELESPADAADLVDRWFYDDRDGLLAFCGAARLLDEKKCTFDCARECAGCVRRSDAQPELFDEGEDRQTPRCYDASCWAEKVAAAEKAAKETARQDTTAGEAPAEAATETPEPAAKKPAAVPPDLDIAARMGAAWAFAKLLDGVKLETLLPSLRTVSAADVRTSGARAALVRKALPRLSRNKAAAKAALKALRGAGML